MSLTGLVFPLEPFEEYLHSFKVPPQCHELARAKWDVYFDKDDLENLQELCNDVGIRDDVSSKTKCKKALQKVHVNIPQLLRAAGNPSLQVIKFESRSALTRFTTKRGKRRERMIRKVDIPTGCPLRNLLEHMS